MSEAERASFGVLGTIGAALDAEGIEVAPFTGGLLCQSGRADELAGLSSIVVDVDDARPAVSLPWAQVRYAAPDVDRLIAFLLDWLPRHASTQAAIDDETLARHGMEPVEARAVRPAAEAPETSGASGDEEGGDEAPLRSPWSFVRRTDGDWERTDAVLDVLARGHLLWPRLLAPRVRSALAAHRASGGGAPDRVHVAPSGVSLHDRPDDPLGPPPLMALDGGASFDARSAVAIVFARLGDVGFSSRPQAVPRLLVIDVGRELEATDEGPFIVHADGIGTYAFGPGDLAFMIEDETGVAYEPGSGIAMVHGAYPRLTDAGRERLDDPSGERGGEPLAAAEPFAAWARSIVATG